MWIESSAPTRIDLAGGTIDIWPLYLFHRNSVTVNIAISVPARCRISPRDDGKFLLRSLDTGESAEFEKLDQLWTTSSLPLLAKLVYFFAPCNGLEMETNCSAPAGSGLAGSSALNIAICGALNELTGSRYGVAELIGIAKNVEAQVISVPTGDQDYYPAAYGGVQAIHLTAGGVRREALQTDIAGLSERLLLIYSGRQRNSGINNWDVMKSHIDGDPKIFRAFEGIIAASNRVRRALSQNRFDLLDEALDFEWENRRILSEGISTPELEMAIAKARSFGARSAKVCGAGGGGCVLMTVSPGRRAEIQNQLKEEGVQVIDFRIAERGVELSLT
jgi:D-glycero-alpha-D-manno-heptose-7-phosphate kinase